MNSRQTYVIGDVQGCYNQARELCDAVSHISPSAEILFLGDVVNRGPDSLQTLRLLRSFGDRCDMVLGNHDLHLLAVANGIRGPGKSDTIHDILEAPDRADLLDWLRHRPMVLKRDGYMLVHGGLLPQWTPSMALELAGEVEAALRGPDCVAFLRAMYGNTPTRWNDTLQGPERLRCIVNAMTRMRYCQPDGTMAFDKEGPAAMKAAGAMPWFDVPGRKSEDTTVVFGHWSQLGLVLRPRLIGLDTGCIWGGKLTAVNLQDRSVIQVDCPQYQRPG